MPRLVAFTGYKGSGKDTAAQPLIERGWVRVAFADPIREDMLRLDPVIGTCLAGGRVELVYLSGVVEDAGWEGAKSMPYVRRMMQEYGQLHRDRDQDYWVNLAVQKIRHYKDVGKHVVITDLRYANEDAMVRQLGGEVIRIIRPGAASDGHSSELQDFPAPHEIHNDGSIGDLHDKVKREVLYLY